MSPLRSGLRLNSAWHTRQWLVKFPAFEKLTPENFTSTIGAMACLCL